MAAALRHVGHLLVLAGGCVAGAASAQPQANTSALLQQFVANSSYQAAVWNSARKQAAAIPDHCINVKPADKKLGIALAAPIAFEKRSGRDFPNSGAWVIHLDADVCGTRRQLNVLSIAKANGSVDLLPLYRGTTRTDPVLQRDATTSAIGFAGSVAKRPGSQGPCKSPLVVDTRLVSIDDRPQPKVLPGRNPYAWHEIWTIDFCGTPIEAAIDFTPDPTGTGFQVHSPPAGK